MNIENEPTKESFDKDFLNFEYLKDINLPEELYPYEGEGRTSFNSKYDTQKIEYLESYGIELGEWEVDRRYVITSLIVFQRILGFEIVRRRNLDTEKYLEIANNDIKKHRLDDIGYRNDLGGGTTYQDLLTSIGASSNPQQKVSREELHGICNYLITSLKQE